MANPINFSDCYAKAESVSQSADVYKKMPSTLFAFLTLNVCLMKMLVIAPAKTGKERSNNKAVITTDQTNKGIRSKEIPVARILITVIIKFTAPKIEEIPAKCNEKIAKSTEAPP
uniref:Uncharacterized protein n=1 Tax=Glossina brevipalpis TaxID=37001 RepID=A0A1A9WWA3_9MUSC